MGGGKNASNVSPSDSDESFVSAELENVAPPTTSSSSSTTSRHDKLLTSKTNISPTRNHRINGRTQRDSTKLSSRIPTSGSYFAHPPGSHPGQEPRSPIQRRPRPPPASRSSHGIETKSGPPPALSTQRSYNNGDSPWRNQTAAESATTPSPLRKRVGTDDSTSIDSILQTSTFSTHDRRNSEPPRVRDGAHTLSTTGTYTAAGMMYEHNGQLLEEDQDRTLRMSGQNLGMRRYTEPENGDQASPEDLFLGLAREDSVADDASETMSRTERRRSRLSGALSRTSHAASTSARPSTSGAQFPSYTTITPQNHGGGSPALERAPLIDSLTALRSDLTRHRPYASSAHPLEEPSRTPQRYLTEKASFSSPMQHYSPESQRAIGRRRSMQATSAGFGLNATEHSHLPRRSRYASPPYEEPSKRGEGTESTVSTQAASTVWDELDDMKSRIRQLELTGKLPSSSNAAISNALGDRPPTAGTTMTTLSSSPKRLQRQSMSPEHSTKPQQPDMAGIHPLLHSALKRAKETISSDVYRNLEATATDALAMAAIAGDDFAQENGMERQLRRKADGMCRSLTELCIALAEEKADSQSPGLRLHAGSKEGTPLTHHDEGTRDSRFLRGVSEDPELRASSRVMSRLESRRTSLLVSGVGQNPRDMSQEPASTPTQPATTFVSKLDRTNSVLRRRERDEESKISRAPSRAATEAGQMRPSPQTRMSREYVSNHPLPNPPQRSPSVQSSLAMPKSYFHGASNSPITPKNILPGTKRYLPGSNPPSTDSTRIAEARQRRMASLGQSSSASPASQPLASRIWLNGSDK